jgi:hypothetical protein
MYAHTHTGQAMAATSAGLVARQGGLSAVFSASRDNGHLAFGLFLGDPRRCPSCARLRLHPYTRGPRRKRQDRCGGIICVTTSWLAMISLVLAPSILSAPPAPGTREFELLPFRRVCYSSLLQSRDPQHRLLPRQPGLCAHVACACLSLLSLSNSLPPCICT